MTLSTASAGSVTAGACLQAIAVLMPLTAVGFTLASWRLTAWVQRQTWWPRALPLQRSMMKNFGYPERLMTDRTCAEFYCFVLLFCSHHIACGLAMMPVALWGWHQAGPNWQAAFLFAALCDVALDIYDWLKHLVLFATHSNFSWLGPPCPGAIFGLLSIHHALAIFIVVPMCVHYPAMPAFSALCVTLLVAAGVTYLTGAYKFTLDTRSPGGLAAYRAIVLLQFVTIWLTRGCIWFLEAWKALSQLRAEGSGVFFACGLAAALCMTIFNVMVIRDATMSANKWLLSRQPSRGSQKVAVADSLPTVLGAVLPGEAVKKRV